MGKINPNNRFSYVYIYIIVTYAPTYIVEAYKKDYITENMRQTSIGVGKIVFL